MTRAITVSLVAALIWAGCSPTPGRGGSSKDAGDATSDTGDVDQPDVSDTGDTGDTGDTTDTTDTGDVTEETTDTDTGPDTTDDTGTDTGEVPAPVAQLSTDLINFGSVSKGVTAEEALELSNAGTLNLVVTGATLTGHPDYALAHGDSAWESGEPVVFDPPVVIGPDAADTFLLSYTPKDHQPAQGKLVLTTNDAEAGDLTVELRANVSGGCIELNPSELHFGAQQVGDQALLPVAIHNCGSDPLTVASIGLPVEANADFALDLTPLPVDLPGGVKLVLQPDEQAVFNVAFTPDESNDLDPVTGEPDLDKTVVIVSSDAFDPKLELPVDGFGVTKACPTAVGVILEGGEVLPQTTLQLFGDQSFAPTSAVVKWKWEVDQPGGSASVLLPDSTFPNPIFTADVAGEYHIALTVTDEEGTKSCIPWKQTVLVVPDAAIHIELLWQTPGDADETDTGPEQGSNLDLHFAHDAKAKNGPDIDTDGQPDPWFDVPHDCFWFNPTPNWGSFDPNVEDDPTLERLDDDGAGPEIIAMPLPEDTLYRVGVHYWTSNGFGPAFANLRVYINADLALQTATVKLTDKDLWNAVTIAGGSGQVSAVTAKEGGPKITPNYKNPFFFEP